MKMILFSTMRQESSGNGKLNEKGHIRGAERRGRLVPSGGAALRAVQHCAKTVMPLRWARRGSVKNEAEKGNGSRASPRHVRRRKELAAPLRLYLIGLIRQDTAPIEATWPTAWGRAPPSGHGHYEKHGERGCTTAQVSARCCDRRKLLQQKVAGRAVCCGHTHTRTNERTRLYVASRLFRRHFIRRAFLLCRLNNRPTYFLAAAGAKARRNWAAK